MVGQTQILHYNVGKRRQVQGSLLNDKELEQYDVLVVLEPYIYPYTDTEKPRTPQHVNWTAITPTTVRTDGHIRHSFRAMLYVNKRTRAQQVAVDSPDIAATAIETEEGTVLLVGAYDFDATATTKRERDRTLAAKMNLIRLAVDETYRERGPEAQILICSDFNRHDTLWGGFAALKDDGRRDEAGDILRFIEEYGLQSLLRPGTVTWEHQTRGAYSTVDVILATAAVAESLTRCGVYTVDHGSDHAAIDIVIDLTPQRYPQRAGKRLYKTADWEKIGEEISDAIREAPAIEQLQTVTDLDEESDRFMRAILATIDQHTQRAKPSPYAKRWWTPTLTTLRQTMTALRNRVTTLRRRTESVEEAKANLHRARQRYSQEIQKQKKAHWKDFLNDPNNIWKANAYTKLANAGTTIPTLATSEGVARKDEEKAKMLMETFFPVPPEPQRERQTADGGNRDDRDHRNHRDDQDSQNTRSIQAPPTTPEISMTEIEYAIWSSSPEKAAGEDEITFAVWRKLWPKVKEWLLALYRASIRLQHLPQSWRTAKIVALRKPGKPNYTLPKAYRPISLLPTISKILEKIVARRLSFLAETYSLLPANHFGGRPKRSSEQAVDVIVEQIHRAWRGDRVLSLVTFDVQGAFNGVHPEILCERMQDRQIPAQLVGWVHSFCSGRTASVVVGQYTSDTLRIRHAGIPQGSPLSPILYVLYNADLVEQVNDRHGGSIGFIDDYTAWVTGPTAEMNTQKLQRVVIPKAEAWARESGATFEAEKTGFVHFSRQPQRLLTRLSLDFNGKVIKDTDRVKILGVTLDQELRMDAHVEKVTTAATAKCLALARLRGLRPKQMRQLYRSVVVPTTDYAASSWFSQSRRGISRLVGRIERAQKMGARIILRAFKGIALRILEAEASLEPVEERLTRKVAVHLASLMALQDNNPLRQNIQDMQHGSTKACSPMQETWQAYRQQYSPRGGPAPIPLRPWITPPWKDRSEQCLDIEQSQVIDFLAREQRQGTAILYTDASVRNRVSGCAAVIASGQGSIRTVYQDTVGWATTCPILSAEIHAIKQAIDYIVPVRSWSYHHYIIATDSQDAIRAFKKGNAATKDREALQGLIASFDEAERYKVNIRLLWVPAHQGVLGNELAHTAAQGMTNPGSRPTSDLTARIREHRATRNLVAKEVQRRAMEKQREIGLGTWGQYTQRLDAALPGKHTLKLYGSLDSDQAAVLVQARTNHTHLNSNLARLQVEESAKCGCGIEDETVAHVLLRCPRWTDIRREMREVAGIRWGDLSYLLGGYSMKKELRTGKPVDGPREKWAPSLEMVKSTIQFLQQTTRMGATPAQGRSSQEQE